MTSAVLQFLITNGLLSAAVVIFALGFWTLVERRQDARDAAFAGFAIAVAFWVFASVLEHATMGTAQQQFWYRATLFVASLVPAAFLLLALSYGDNRLPSPVMRAAIFAPNAVVLVAAFKVSLLVTQEGALVVPAQSWFGVHFAAVTVIALAALLYASLVRKLIAQTALATIIGGSLLSFGAIFLELYAASTLTYFVEPWVLNAASSVTLIIGIAIISAATIQKKPDLQLRRTGIELTLLLLLIIFTAGSVISAPSPFEFTFRLVLLLLLVIYGTMALRTFVREMQRLKEIEGLHDRLTQLNAVLMRADRLKTRFVSFASHQLRAPLGGIRGYLDMLNRGDFGAMPDAQKRVIGLNLDAVNRLTQTIEMFLDVTKIELGKLDLYVTPTVLADLIAKSVAEMKPLADKKGLDLVVDLPPSLPTVQCDSAKIFHVMVNFIDNAIKYTPAGRITVRAREESGFLVVEVVDTGIGMDQTDRSRLFHLFERGISAVKLESSGEGLGLYIAKNIIDAHAGTVFIESAGKEKGSTFGFRLPLAAKPV